MVVALPEGHALAQGQARAVLPLKRLSDETFVVNRQHGGRAWCAIMSLPRVTLQASAPASDRKRLT